MSCGGGVKSVSVSLHPDRLTVLTFHGVVEDGYTHPVRNQTGKHITASRFKEIIRGLLGKGNPVSLDHLDELPPFPYAVTFDDGFSNVLRNAVPILRAYRVPATFFINPQFCYAFNSGHTWADLLEQHYATHRPDRAARLLHHHRDLVKNTPYIDPYRYARWILDGTIPESDPQLDPKLSWDELKDLAADPLFTIGGHGDDHRILTHLDDSGYELEHNIGTCLSDLHVNVGSVTLFSYPDGRHNQKVIDTLKRHGITHAFTTEPGSWVPGDDPYRIPRLKAA